MTVNVTNKAYTLTQPEFDKFRLVATKGKPELQDWVSSVYNGWTTVTVPNWTGNSCTVFQNGGKMNKFKELEKRNLSFCIDVDVGSAAYEIATELDQDEIVEFVKLLDLTVADWGVTVALHDYFKEQKKIYDNEVAEDED